MIFTSSIRGLALTTLLGCTVLSLSACASGPKRGDGPPGGKRGGATSSFEGVGVYPIGILFTEMDTDGDGKTSRAELAAGRDAQWESPEFSSSPSQIRFGIWSRRVFGSSDIRPGFMSFDRNFDSIISEDEFKETLGREFERLDKNKDGFVERSELVFMVEPQTQQPRQQGGQSGGGGGGQGGGGGGGRPQR